MCQLCRSRTRGLAMISVFFLSVFKEKLKHLPSRAQSLSYALASADASYLSSIIQLFKNLNFVLLVITYGMIHMCLGCTGTGHLRRETWCFCVSYCFQIPNVYVKSSFRVKQKSQLCRRVFSVPLSLPRKPFLPLSSHLATCLLILQVSSQYVCCKAVLERKWSRSVVSYQT